MSNQDGQSAYSAAVELNKAAYGKDVLGAEIANNNFLGNNMLKEDLGIYRQPSSLMSADDLDDRTRDRLISYTRQDVASALGHAQSAFRAAYAAKEDARRTKRLARWLIFFAIIQVLMSVMIFLVIA